MTAASRGRIGLPKFYFNIDLGDGKKLGFSEKRRLALPGVRTCIACQSARDARRTATGGINRRGSKDSQLR